MRISDGSSDVCSSDLSRDIGRCSCALPKARDIVRRGTGANKASPPWKRGLQEISALEACESLMDDGLSVVDDALAELLACWDIVDEYLDHTGRSDEHTSELQSLMLNSYAVYCF